MQNLTLKDCFLATRAAATLHRLSLLDGIWTSYLDEAVTIPKRDYATLGSLTREMSSLLTEAKDQSQLLRKPIARLSIDWNQRFDSMVRSARLSPAIKSNVLARVRRDGGIRSLTLFALNEIVGNASEDQKELRRKMEIIRKGRFVPGDLRLVCMIDAACIGIGLGLGGFGGAAVAVAAFGLSVRNHCWG